MANSVDNLLFVIGYMRSEIENLKDVGQRYKNVINEQRKFLLERGERIKKLEKELTALRERLGECGVAISQTASCTLPIGHEGLHASHMVSHDVPYATNTILRRDEK